MLFRSCSGGAALGFLVGGPVGAALCWGVGMIAGATGGGIVGKKISEKIEKNE